LKHRLRSSNEVCDGYRTAVDETAGVTSIAQSAVSDEVCNWLTGSINKLADWMQ